MIVENLTRWDTDDLVRLLDRAREVAPVYATKHCKPWTNDETIVVVRHYSSTERLIAPKPSRRTNTGALLIRRPGRVDIGVVDALASIADGDGGDGAHGIRRMPHDMLNKVWATVVGFMIGSYSIAHLKPALVPPGDLQVRVARCRGTAAPKWIEHQLGQARIALQQAEKRWVSERARLAGRVAQLEARLEGHDS